MKFQTLYGQTKSGKIKEWDIEAFQHEDGTASFVVTHGQQNGKKSSTTQFIETGKNIGKANQTTPYEQACAEAQSRVKKQLDSGYALSVEEIKTATDKEFFLPMLAHRYDQYSSKIKFPAASQVKYDGCRCLAQKRDGKVVLWSRKGKVIDVPKEIIKELEETMAEGQAYDGELYNHEWRTEGGDPNFQRIISAIKKYNKDTALLEYHVYDLPDQTKTFVDRFINFPFQQTQRVKRATTVIVNSEEEALDYYHQAIIGEKPFEGTMLRNLHGKYLFDHRSYDLQKLKPQQDSEFKIIGGKEGTGNDLGTVIFECETEIGQKFHVRPIGTREVRTEYWENLQKYIGRSLTVQYNGKTSDGLPRFPRGIKIREEWDG